MVPRLQTNVWNVLTHSLLQSAGLTYSTAQTHAYRRIVQDERLFEAPLLSGGTC